MFVCICHGVTDQQIREAADAGARTLSQLQMRTGCGSTCGQCQPAASDILFKVTPRPQRLPNALDDGLLPAMAGA